MRKDNFFSQASCCLVIACFCVHMSDGSSRQSVYFPTNRRKLSSLIITRDHISRPPLYGAHGSTAAEFVVSAGLDTSKSAVRIRRLRREMNQNSSVAATGERIKNDSQILEMNDSQVLGRNKSQVLERKDSKMSDGMPQRLQRQIRHQFNSADHSDSVLSNPMARFIHIPSVRDMLLNLTAPLLRYVLASAPRDDFLERSSHESIRLHKFERIPRDQNNTTISNSKIDPINNSSLEMDPNLRNKLTNFTVPLLRHLIASHLLQGVLSLRNLSATIMNASTSSPHNSMENSYILPTASPHGSLDTSFTLSTIQPEPNESLTRSEQRHRVMMMNPYHPHHHFQYPYLHRRLPPPFVPPIAAPARVPVFRVLKGKLVPIPHLPSDLIPYLLDNPQRTPPPSDDDEDDDDDDMKLTEKIIDAAIYALLQSEDLLNLGSLSPSSDVLNERKTVYPTSQPVPLKSFESYMQSGKEPRCDRLTDEICLEDSDYPSSAIMSSIYKDKNKFDLMYAEIKERESQVDGLSRIQEQAYNYEHYYGSASSVGNLRPKDYSARGGFVCPSEVHYGRPHRAKNRKGEWKVVVNVAEYTQTIRMEKCLSANLPCKYVVNKIHSTCSQVYSYHRLLVFNKEQGLHIDAFRMPTGCTCHIRGHKYVFPQPLRNYEEFGGHVESAPQAQVAYENTPQAHVVYENSLQPPVVYENSPQTQVVSEGNQQQKKHSFGNTLWAILGGGQQAGALAQSPQFQDEVQKHISWTQNLQPFPQFFKHVSPAQVLKQLLEEEDDMISIRRQPVRRRPPVATDPRNRGGYPSHHLPIVVRGPNLREPTPALRKNPLPRRPVAVDQKQVYIGVPVRAAAKTLPVRVKPGMYFTSSEVNTPDDKSAAVSQFPDTAAEETGLKPISKPVTSTEAPPSKEEVKDGGDDGDLLALEKTETTPHVFNLDNLSSSDSKDILEASETKINFSYHPILEYLSLSK